MTFWKGGDQIELTAKQIRFFIHAQHMADMSDFKRARIGCVAVIGNHVVATGFSQHRTHPLQQRFNAYRDFDGQENIQSKLHSEIAMLSSARHRGIAWNKVDIYIYRKCRSRPHGLALPCSGCRAALAQAGIKSIFYTTDTGYDHIKI